MMLKLTSNVGMLAIYLPFLMDL